jgi:hypothetical protein
MMQFGVLANQTSAYVFYEQKSDLPYFTPTFQSKIKKICSSHYGFLTLCGKFTN